MGKQAISSQPLDFSERLENKSFSLVYPQRPPVTTWTAEATGYSDEPTGQAVVVAIQCITGFNQEDSVLMNRDAQQRGLFRTAVHRTFKDSEAKHGADLEKFNKCPDEGLAGRRKGDYSKIDEDDGIAPIGTKLKKNDVIIGKTIEFTRVSKNNFSEEKKYTSSRRKRDRSTLMKTDEDCRVEKVVMSCTKDGLRSASLRTIAFRSPEIGDKVSSLHGQKGIVGMIIPAIDMPRTKDGVIPDIIMNVHAVPSRMTIGMLKEMHMGKLACLEGLIADGTPFRNKTVKEMETLLRDTGLHGLGKEVMYSGTTGKKLDNPVFLGVCYYQRLRHMVQDKIHGRARGPNQVLTRQPVEGRSRKGGFRLGEMERDSLISHGVSSILIDRLLNNSDRFETVVCETCGMLCEGAAPTDTEIPSVLHQKPYCRHCDSSDNIAPVVLPYALKLLSQELAACHVKMKFEF